MRACLKEQIMCFVCKHTAREFVNVCKYNKRVNILPLTRNSHTRDPAVSDHEFAYSLNYKYKISNFTRTQNLPHQRCARVFVVTRQIDKQRPRVRSRWTETCANNLRFFVPDAGKWNICKYLESIDQVAERSKSIRKRQNFYLRSLRDG